MDAISEDAPVETAPVVMAHPGNIARDGRGFRKHFWTCCGCKLNTDSPHDEEMAELQAAFDATDTGTGRIDRAGMVHLCKSLGKADYNRSVDSALAHLEPDAAGTVEFAEFKDHWSCHLAQRFTGEGRMVEGTVVERALAAKDRIKSLEGQVRDIKARPGYRSAELDEATAKLDGAKKDAARLDATLRRALPCSEAERQAWKLNEKHMHHVFEVLQTEETYVKTLHFMYLVWYRPLADGTHGAPKLSRPELDSLFSTLFAPDADEQAQGHSDGESPQSPLSNTLADRAAARSGRQMALGAGLLMRNFTLSGESLSSHDEPPGAPPASAVSADDEGRIVLVKDITTLQTEYVLKLLTEEDRKEQPNIPQVFATRLRNRRLVSYLEMYAPFAANFQSAQQALKKLKDEKTGFARYADSVGRRWNTKEARAMLKSLGLKSIPVQLGQLLTIPVQRVPRYRLLLSELQKHRPSDDPVSLTQLKQVLSAVDTVAHSLDEFTLEQEAGLTKVAQIADLMGRGGSLLRQAAGIDLVVPGRSWILGDGNDAMFYLVDPETLKPRRKPVQLLLFEDLLVMAEVSEASANYALDYLHHFDLQEGLHVCMKTTEYLLFQAFKRSGTDSTDSQSGGSVMSTMLLASEYGKGTKRAQQHVHTLQTTLHLVGQVCDALARQEAKSEQARTLHGMHERQAPKPHYTQLHMLQLTAFENGLADYVDGLEKDAAAAAAAATAAAKRGWCF
jgi:hypothetical protein